MSRIKNRLASLNGNKALVAFYTAGDPDMEASKEIFAVIEKNGADIVEIGVPFSDPLADGPTIQASSHRSLKNGTTLKKIIRMVADIRKTSELPVVLMTSFNPIFVYGQKDFVDDAVNAGVDGVIIPDLPPEESEGFLGFAKGMDMLFLLAPTSTPARLKQVGQISKGFIYYIQPIVIFAFVLGGLIEENLRRSLLISDGSWNFLWNRPLTLSIMLVILLIVGWQIFNSFKNKRFLKD